MCQFIICDCWWHNCGGILCGGCYQAGCCCSMWLCMPDEMSQIDPDCCKVGCCLGWGYNHCCHGNVCCITDSFRTYSNVVTLGADVVSVNSGQPMEPFNRGYWRFLGQWYFTPFMYDFKLFNWTRIAHKKKNQYHKKGWFFW